MNNQKICTDPHYLEVNGKKSQHHGKFTRINSSMIRYFFVSQNIREFSSVQEKRTRKK